MSPRQLDSAAGVNVILRERPQTMASKGQLNHIQRSTALVIASPIRGTPNGNGSDSERASVGRIRVNGMQMVNRRRLIPKIGNSEVTTSDYSLLSDKTPRWTDEN